MTSVLKRLRLKALKTQNEVASEVGVVQSTYQRWEKGTTPVPENCKNKLSFVLGVTEKELDGELAPFDFFGVNRSIDENRSYYGEIAIHFLSGSSLLFPVTYGTVERVEQQLKSRKFILIHSLDNRICIINKKNITDMYFSNDSADKSGPEIYTDNLGIFPDEMYWVYVESLITGCDVTDSSEKDIAFFKNVLKEQNVLDPDITQRLTRRATEITVAYSNGKLRQLMTPNKKELHYSFSTIVNSLISDKNFIFYNDETEGQVVLINPKQTDYIYFPKHKYDLAEIEQFEEDNG